jgi:hypothetical protein
LTPSEVDESKWCMLEPQLTIPVKNDMHLKISLQTDYKREGRQAVGHMANSTDHDQVSCELRFLAHTLSVN